MLDARAVRSIGLEGSLICAQLDGKGHVGRVALAEQVRPEPVVVDLVLG